MAILLDIREATALKGSVEHTDEGSKAQRIFFLRFDSKPTDLDDVLNAAGVPAIGNAFKSGDSRKLKSKSPASMGTPTDYIVTCNYETPSNELTYNANPLSRPDLIESFDGSSKDETYFEDHSDPPERMTNVWGEPFDSLPTRQTGEFGMTVTGNRAINADIETWLSMLSPNSVNQGSVTIRGRSFGDGVLRFANFSAKPTYENQYSFLACKWFFAIAPKWEVEYEHRGFFYEDEDGVPWPIVQGDPAEPVTKSWPLDEDGQPLDAADATPAKLTRLPYPKRSFGLFSFTAAA